MLRPVYPVLAIVILPGLSFVIHAASCPREITESCSVDTELSSQGHLYEIQDGATGNVNVSAAQQALQQGEVFRFVGSSTITLELQSGIRLTSDYNVIALPENTSVSQITVNGELSSAFQHCLSTTPGSQYGTVVISEPASLNSGAEAALRIDGGSSGALTISGSVRSGAAPALMYTSTPPMDLNSPWSVGVHALTISETGRLESAGVTDMDAPLAFGDPMNINILNTLPEYRFTQLQIDGKLIGNTALLQRHGTVQVDNLTIGVSGVIQGKIYGIRLGRRTGDIDQATFSATNGIINQGQLSAYGTVVYAEGDVTGPFINQGRITVLNDPPSAIQATPAAFDYRQCSYALELQQSTGEIQGDIYGSGMTEGNRIGLTGGKIHGRLMNIQTLDIADTGQMHLTGPATLESLSLNGELKLELDQLGDESAYVDAADITLKDNSRITLNTVEAEAEQRYPLLASSDPITGELSELSSLNLALSATPEQSANALDALIQPRSTDSLQSEFKSAGLSDNQSSNLAQQVHYGTSATQETLNNLYAESGAASLQPISKELTPGLSYPARVAMDTGSQLNGRISQRILAMTPALTGIAAGDAEAMNVAWGQIHGDWGEQDSSGDATGYETESQAITVGYDRLLNDSQTLLGLALTAGKSDIDFSATQKTEVDTLLVSVYGTSLFSSIGVEAQLTWGRFDNEESRSVQGQKHRSSYNSDLYGLLLLGYKSNSVIQPLVGLSATRVKTDSHRFDGVYLNDAIEGDTHDALQLGLGVRYYQPAEQGLVPRAQLTGWYDVKNEGIDTRYRVGDSPTITVTGDKPEPFSLSALLAADYLHGNATYSCSLNGSYRSDYHDLGIGCRVRFEF